MPFSRPSIAMSQHRFGRAPARAAGNTAKVEPSLTDDLRLFAATFAAGFLFVSILIG